MPVEINREPVKPVTTPIKDVVLTSEGGMGYTLSAFNRGGSSCPVAFRLPRGNMNMSTDTARKFALGLIELCDQIDGAR